MRRARWLDLTYLPLGRNPAVFSRRSPAPTARPRTDGTGARALVVTVGVVVCTVVVPPPVPRETLTVTVEPLSTSLPAAGFCATTCPTGFVDGTFCNCGWRPSFVSCDTAGPCV